MVRKIGIHFHCVNLIALSTASKSYIRPYIRVKSTDTIYTTSNPIPWAIHAPDQGPSFNLSGCITIVLILKQGAENFPSFDEEHLKRALKYV